MAFVHTTWNEGIEPWRFQIPTEYDGRLTTAHTVFDRPLFRAGETVHMKHFLRRHSTAGFALMRPEEMPGRGHVTPPRHQPAGIRSSSNGTQPGPRSRHGPYPEEAKLGEYQVVLGEDRTRNEKPYGVGLSAGMFRVEEYRVPLMRASYGPRPVPSSRRPPFRST